jgi:hypothetical protein
LKERRERDEREIERKKRERRKKERRERQKRKKKERRKNNLKLFEKSFPLFLSISSRFRRIKVRPKICSKRTDGKRRDILYIVRTRF